jgi:hypothetical protein
MSARSNMLHLTVFGLLLARAPRWVQRVLAYMLLGFVLFFVLIVLGVAARSEQAKDVLLAVLEDASGKTSLHQQLSADCMAFLSGFMKREREGVATFLTFEAPPAAHGKVLAIYCVRPNGETVCSKPIGNIPCKQGDF